MSSSIAISAAALAIAAQASKKAECISVIDHYDTKTTNITEMQKYADCVNLIHPEAIAMTGSDVLILKMIFVIALISGGFMGVNFYKLYHDWSDFIVGFLFGFVVGPLLVFALFLLGYGVMWLFS